MNTDELMEEGRSPIVQAWTVSDEDLVEGEASLLDLVVEGQTAQTTTTTTEKDLVTECKICYEELSPVDVYSINKCGHLFCRSCLQAHVRYSIRQVPLVCPREAETDCSGFLSMGEIEVLLIEEDFRKHARIYRLHHDPTLLQCPQCDALSEEDDEGGIDESPTTTCIACNHMYCKVHGDAHDPATQSCVDFEKQQNGRHNRKSMRAIHKLTKPCSHCEAPIIKYAGCDHVVCTACNQDMCWHCGTHAFMTGRVMRTCHKCKNEYLDHRHQCAATTCVCLISTPIAIVYMIVVGLSIVLTGCGFGCLACGKWIDDEDTFGGKKGPWAAFQWLTFAICLPLIAVAQHCGISVFQERWDMFENCEEREAEEEVNTSNELPLDTFETTSDVDDPSWPFQSNSV